MDRDWCEAAALSFLHEVCNARDRARAEELLAPDFLFHSSFGASARSVTGFLDHRAALLAAIPDHQCRVDRLIADRGAAAARITFTGHFEGPFLGFAPHGGPLAWTGAAFFEMAGGLIRRVWFAGDLETLRAQLAGDGDRLGRAAQARSG